MHGPALIGRLATKIDAKRKHQTFAREAHICFTSIFISFVHCTRIIPIASANTSKWCEAIVSSGLTTRVAVAGCYIQQ
jgi:hypothetical protein